MKLKDFESACRSAISGCLWDESFSTDYHESVSLTVKEMREIANTLKRSEACGTIDLNTVNEIENNLSEDEGGEYEIILERICQRDLISSGSNHWLRFKLVNATAGQRAEALREMGKLK